MVSFLKKCFLSYLLSTDISYKASSFISIRVEIVDNNVKTKLYIPYNL